MICAFLCGALLSCGENREIAMTLTYGNNTTTMCANIYGYYLSYTKTMLLANFLQMGISLQDINSNIDRHEYWAEQGEDGITRGDIVKAHAEENMKQFLAVAAYCKENGLELSREQRNNIDQSVKDLINSDKYRRSRANLNSVLIRFNINDSILTEIRRLESLMGVMHRHLFDPETGARQVADEMIYFAYQEMCSRVKHILIQYTPGEISEETQTKIDDIYGRIRGGEDFDSLLHLSEDPGSHSQPDGYTVRGDTSFVPEFLFAALDMEIGEVRKVESEFGMHIMKRYELLHPEQTRDINTGETWMFVIERDIRAHIVAEELRPFVDAVAINREQTDLFSTATSSTMFDVQELLQW
jgi:hypothetical protein